MRVGILTVSDRASHGTYDDETGPAVQAQVDKWPESISFSIGVIADDRDSIANCLREWARTCDLILTNGGTGLGERDVTPEATLDVITRQVPGITELMRAEGLKSTSHAALSRQIAGQLGNCLIINLPGSPKGAVESLVAVEAILPHAVKVIANVGH